MRTMFTVVGMTASLLASAMSPAQAEPATGFVLVFETEFTPAVRFENPSGCYKLPLTSHVLVNQTASTVTVHADPLCLLPGLPVAPGYGSHVALGTGSFSA